MAHTKGEVVSCGEPLKLALGRVGCFDVEASAWCVHTLSSRTLAPGEIALGSSESL